MAFARWARGGTGRWIAGAVACGSLLVATPASAATYHASPTGSGPTPCAEANPCSLPNAVAVANSIDPARDVIVVAPGSYSTTQLTVTEDVDIVGAPGGPLPQITVATTNHTVVQVSSADVTLTDLDLRNTGTTGTGRGVEIFGPGTLTLDRVRVRSTVGSAVVQANPASNLTMRNSSAHSVASVNNVVTVSSSALAEIFDSTVVKLGTSGGDALFAAGAVTVRGSILDGDATASGLSGHIDIAQSNYRSTFGQAGGTVSEGPGKQTALPLFADRDNANLRQAVGSPTIDAGVLHSGTGPDFDAEGRPGGTAPDIGADEHYADGPVRYAAANAIARGTCSAPAAACSLEHAVEDVAQHDDEVVVLPGTYPLSETLTISKRLDVHGDDGGAPPTLTGSFTGVLVEATAGAATRIAHLRIDHTGTGGTALRSAGTVAVGAGVADIERVYAIARGTDARAIEVGSGDVVRNTVAWVPDGLGTAVYVDGATSAMNVEVRNVTAVAPDGEGVALHGAGPDLVVARNVIASGLSDFSAYDAGGSATIDVGFSNYGSAFVTSGATVTPAGTAGSSMQPPVFADATAGDFHQSSLSPTVNTGFTSGANGSRDIDGDARTLGAGTDMGADEFHPGPTAATDSATDVDHDSATLRGSSNPLGRATSVHFEYGTTTSYGSQTTAQAIGSGSASTSFQATVDGLQPATTYHFRAVAVNSAGTANGADMTLTTPAAPVQPGPSGGGGGPSGGAGPPGGSGPPGGAGPPGGGPPVLDRVAPGLQSFSITRRSFRRGTRGIQLRWTLTEAARATITIDRKTTGRRVGRRCVKATRRNSSRRKCTRYVKQGTITRNSTAGSNRLAFSGRVGRKNLAVGTYRATIVARDAAGNTSRKRTLSFKIVRR
jgi:hypothetical protein